ncbi:bifunctional 4-hydroxy-2-oxoglutarate aldolase/2-dehydro-3-deoxy-phosphogluconate aldolase [Streptomyces sp. ST2-7A]|uniref:bifunctional 4-hydroxy-2-oxoglutarate aldolase/2-dehydro-3-deoxy-phosphogluconate aldolase n=1 Tax=Streptomyces sp. ST2-7A TaxID=2907214 RepID=UPI001F3FEF81|nr:bifunctional 4-hydroxy-2-oxoglutarate aldolase/2-dehydro-3-deoxy-phosphogluconate aldolase [Streptomyces sp. ST2-7A]MCE7080401.1 bifunctional 4-hydroxy-2-oxoglutarate aldolase/2-dehydro-3-deoxy-phosphogluconate aldolase [Streptomyces sp. ST2-7A]
MNTAPSSAGSPDSTGPTGPTGPEVLLARLRRERLAAIVRGRDARASVRAAVALAEEGVGLIEISLTTENAERVLSEVVAEVGDRALIGAGTVLCREDADRARGAGAAWLVTPCPGAGLEAAVDTGLPVLGGALTPGECAAVMAAGAAAVKLFPASLGGPPYLKSLRDPFPDLPIVPVGGIDADAAAAYLAAGAVAVGVGGPLLGDAPHGGDTGALRERARTFLAVCADGADA